MILNHLFHAFDHHACEKENFINFFILCLNNCERNLVMYQLKYFVQMFL